MNITKDKQETAYITGVSFKDYREYYITITPQEHEDETSLINRAKDILIQNNCSVVKWDIFGSCRLYGSVMPSIESSFDSCDWPISWMEGAGCRPHGIAGMMLYAVSDISVESLYLKDRPIGRVFSTRDAKYCFLGGVLPSDTDAPHREQTQSVLEQIEQALGYAGMTWEHVVRTWYYNDAICVWYNDFNEVRTAFYNKHHVGQGILPASTGIGAGNPVNAALQVQVMAVCPEGENFQTEKIISPLQCPASDYGSSFSRVLKIKEQDIQRLFISGTASVGQEGDTLYTGDIDSQIRRTADVIQAILDSQGMSLEDTVRAVAYVKDESDSDRIECFYEHTGVEYFPVIITRNEICRDDLLFEIELDCVHE